MPEYTGPLPTPTPESRPFWDALKRHEFSLPRCGACGRMHYYPRASCPHCLSGDLAWVRASGRGTLHTFTVVHRGLKGFPIAPLYVIAIVELDEGPRLMTNLVGVEPDPARIRIGMPVEIVYEDVTPAVTLARFRPVGGAG